ncbi:clasp N terminal-domain-containing protein [Paecilomyces variotii]|uniref:Clasp N terminal-domain-containing protein n=1 Tax=Byssochlamys spectabilis TaxID=264951 RepID=A0A443HIL2_BYSSP|nr:clasp N terminal-domain-containing protein [Paecilomyces variotii]RWQ91635.1 clasp N terminal-domain-containing protein [Paecilomyces variotii]
MEAKAIELLAILRNSNASVDTKVTHMTALKSEIKQKNVPESAITPIFDSVKQAIASPHTSLSGAGFSALGHLLKRLGIQQQQHAVVLQSRYLYPLLLERLGDHKERVRAQAAQAFTELWSAAGADVEHHVLEVALTGKNPRAKETAMNWLSTMTKQYGLLFKNHVGRLVACLEDADSGVRDTAKATVIELFQTAPPRAKSDLKKQLTLLNVRKSIATAIINSIDLDGSVDQEMSTTTTTTKTTMTIDPQPRVDSALRPASSFSHRAPTTKATMTIDPQPRVDSQPRFDSALRPASSFSHRAPTTKTTMTIDPQPRTDEGEKIDPLYIHSHREIDDMTREMTPDFEGRESEQNWTLREKHVMTLRRLTRGNAPHTYPQQYLAAIKTLLDGILKTVNSLRTTLSTAGCLLIQDLARVNGPGIDHMVEILMQNMIKMCAIIKKISAHNGKVTVDAIIAHVSYTPRLLQHLWLACQDKNTQPRLFVTGWLKTLIQKQAQHKASVEHGGGLDLLEKCIKKGLADANPGVREGMRGTFWAFYAVWPDRANEILSTLDSKSRSLLEKDPANPNHGEPSLSTSDQARPAFSKSTSAAPTRTSLKEAIAAQRKAKMAAASKATPDAKHAPSAAAPTSSLSSAPMRPALKPRRPEASRPVTPATRPSHPVLPKSTTDSAPTTTTTTRPETFRPVTPTARSSNPVRPKSTTDSAPTTATTTTKPKRLGGFQSTDTVTTVEKPEAKPEVDSMEYETVTIEKPEAKPEADTMELQTVTTVEKPELKPEADTVELQTVTTVEKPELKLEADTMELQTVTTVEKPELKLEADTMDPETVKVYEDSQSNDLAKSFEFSEDKLILNDTPSPFLLRPERLQRMQQMQNENMGPDHSSLSTPCRTISSPLEERSLNDSSLRLSSLSLRAASNPDSNPTSNPTSRANRESWIRLEFAHRCKSISPRSKDPAAAREILEKGITKIKDNKLDVYGYRKIQGLIKFHESMFNPGENADTDHLYMLLLLALFSALEKPPTSKLPAALDIKVQILVTIRVIYMFGREQFAPYYPTATTAMLKARKYYDATHYIVSGLEETFEDFVVDTRDGHRMIRAVLDQIETEKRDREGLRAVNMGIWVLTMLLRDCAMTKTAVQQPLLERVASFTRSNLSDKDPEVRKGVMDLCVPLFGVFANEDAFFRAVDANRQQKNLILYYVTTNR